MRRKADPQDGLKTRIRCIDVEDVNFTQHLTVDSVAAW